MMIRRFAVMALVAWLLAGLCAGLGEGLAIVADEPQVPELEDVTVGMEDADACEVETELPGADDPDGNETGEIRYGWEETNAPNAALADHEALFAGYVERLFGTADGSRHLDNGLSGQNLVGCARDMYVYLLERVREVAAGELSSTCFYIPLTVVPRSSIREGLSACPLVLRALRADCPYDMYWMDLHAYCYCGSDQRGLYLNIPVVKEYAVDTYTTRSDLLHTAQDAAKNAREVVRQYAGQSDYEKLRSYLHWICDATKYNYDAAEAMAAYGSSNPWQLIWVFDGDPSTTVVCEGYSKAFQYLCDSSEFVGDIQCCSVTGTLQQKGGGGPHMWNIVRMGDGKNYLADITNCDSLVVVSEDLFLKGYHSTDGTARYTFVTYLYATGIRFSGDPVILGTDAVSYTYSSDTLEGFPASALLLSDADYDPGNAPVLHLTPTSVSLDRSGTVSVTLGKMLKLKATVMPENARTTLTWSSSDDGIAKVSQSGKVTPVRTGTARITVATTNGKKDSVKVKVVAPQPSSVSIIQGKKATLRVGDKLKLETGMKPQGAKSKLSWKSSNGKVASVSQKGVVKAKKAGKATITVTAANGRKASIRITVKDRG